MDSRDPRRRSRLEGRGILRKYAVAALGRPGKLKSPRQKSRQKRVYQDFINHAKPSHTRAELELVL
jgi:hypothetical protein